MLRKLTNLKFIEQAKKTVFWVPILTLIVGSAISLSLSSYIQKQELDFWKQDSYQQAHEAVNQIDLQLSNSLLRVQTYEEYFGGTKKSYTDDKAFISQALEYTVFHRLSIFRETLRPQGARAFKLIMRINKKSSELPPPMSNSYATSPDLAEAIQKFEMSSSYFMIVVFEYQNVVRFSVLMRSKSREDTYFIFSAPLLSILEKVDFGNLSSVEIFDINKNQNRWIVAQNGAVKTIGRVSAEGVSSKSKYFEFNFEKGLPQSGLGLGLQFNYVRVGGPLVSTARIVGALSLLLTIIISYLFYVLITSNRNANRMIIRKTIDLEKTAHDLQMALNGKSRFLGKISHEIRTPLNLILGMIDLCSESDIDNRLQGYLRSMKSSGGHLLTMIDDLINLSKAESNDLSYEGRQTHLIQFLGEVTKLIASDCHSKNLALYTYFDPELPKIIVCDPNRLRQILLNLLRNAFKYTSHGYLQVNVTNESSVKTENVKVRFEVKDTGIGIPPDKVSRIFDAFFQVENSNVFSDGGVGLGLSIVKDIVKKMNGQIHVHSIPEIGTLFQVDLEFEVFDGVSWLDGYIHDDALPKSIFIISTDPLFQRACSALARHPEISLSILPFSKEQKLPFEKFRELNSFVVLDTKTCGHYLPELLKFRKDKYILLVGPVKSKRGFTNDPIVASIDNVPILAHEILVSIGYSAKAHGKYSGKARAYIGAEKSFEVLMNQELKVVVADDDFGNIELYKAYFKKMRWSVEYALDGIQALAFYQARRPDLMIVDVRMPVMDGFQLIEKIRQHEAINDLGQVPIVLVTADLIDSTIERAKQFSGVYFLSKPIKKSVLLETIERVVASVSLELETSP
jgi:signal transduction histidine kinase/ActR/RegA family two-component response regulator